MRHSTFIATLVLALANITYAETNAAQEASSLAVSSSIALKYLEAPGAGSKREHKPLGPNFAVQRHELQKRISEKIAQKLEQQLNRELEHAAPTFTLHPVSLQTTQDFH